MDLVPPDVSMNLHIRPFRVDYCYGIPSIPLRRHDLYQLSPLYLAGVIACLNEPLRHPFCQKASSGQ